MRHCWHWLEREEEFLGPEVEWETCLYPFETCQLLPAFLLNKVLFFLSCMHLEDEIHQQLVENNSLKAVGFFEIKKLFQQGTRQM